MGELGHSSYELLRGASEARGVMDRTNFREELERMHGASFGWALWCCGHRREEAEDVLQSAYLKVFDGAARFDGRSSPRTWFFGVIRRTAAERERRQWMRRQLFDRWLVREPPALPAPGPEAMACESEMRRNLLRAVAELSTRQRQVLHLVFYQELTIEEASRVMNLSLGTARTHFDRGKRRLREILVEQEAHDDRR
jgi:RNA polymerase sigma factor (sigma-70 family)